MSESSKQQCIVDNWQRVQAAVRDACLQHGRDVNSVQIVGVSKYVDVETTRLLVAAGCHCLGESRPQTLWQKADELRDYAIQWHLIGHLQRNKVRRLLKCDPIIESVDSQRLVAAIASECAQQQRDCRILLEVNISGDQAKTGFAPDAIAAVLESLPQPGIQVAGLMAMAGWGTDPEDARRQFAQTRQLRDQLVEQVGVPLPHLSMGMSGDFPQAIAEGATIVRIGSKLFEGVR